MTDDPSNDVASDAVLVSIPEYPDADGLLRPLPGAARDSKRVSKWLAANAPSMVIKDFSWPLPSGGLQGLWNNYRLQGEMHDLVRNALQRPRGRLFGYFSCHGRLAIRDPAMPEVYCASYKRAFPDLFASAGWIRLLTAVPAYNEYIFFFDCCNEWQPGQPALSPDLNVRYREDRPSVLVVAACRPNQQALETANGGVFTDVLLEALSGSAGSVGTDVTARDVVDYLKKHVPVRAAALKPGHVQIPYDWFDSQLHADLAKFRLFRRPKVSVDVSAIVSRRAPSEVEVLGADLEPLGRLLPGTDGEVLLEAFPGKYVLRAPADGWRQVVLVRTSVNDAGVVNPVVEPVALA